MKFARLRPVFGVLHACLLVAAAIDGYELVGARTQNAAIVAGAGMASEERRPHLVFASAAQLAGGGDFLRALTLYRQVVQDGTTELKIAARYNGANLQLREAIRMRESGDPAAVAQALPLLELAKLGYRDVLRDRPQHWDARYNLERALRLAPEGSEFEEVAPPPMYIDRALPTMKGVPPGLP